MKKILAAIVMLVVFLIGMTLFQPFDLTKLEGGKFYIEPVESTPGGEVKAVSTYCQFVNMENVYQRRDLIDSTTHIPTGLTVLGTLNKVDRNCNFWLPWTWDYPDYYEAIFYLPSNTLEGCYYFKTHLSAEVLAFNYKDILVSDVFCIKGESELQRLRNELKQLSENEPIRSDN